MFLVQEFFAGAWSLIWHWGAGVAIIILCLAAAYFSPLYKKYFLGAAAVVALCLAAYGTGIADQEARCKAELILGTKHINQVVTKAIKSTKTKKAKARADKWNNKDF
jgi:hypothetical protein